MRFDEKILQEYPCPVAIAAGRVNNAIKHVEIFLALANLFEMTLKYLASVWLAQYLRPSSKDPNLQQQLKKLSRSSLGVWKETLCNLIMFFDDNQIELFLIQALRDGDACKLGQKQPDSAKVQDCFRFVAHYLEDEQTAAQKQISIQNL